MMSRIRVDIDDDDEMGAMMEMVVEVEEDAVLSRRMDMTDYMNLYASKWSIA